ncbi:hypothetical protein RKD49_001895 [Streptomyces glaucescens]|jgi:hypothetical protein
MRRLAALLACVCLLWSTPGPAAAAGNDPVGWAATGPGTTGGPAAVEHYVLRHAGAGRPHG